MKPLRITFWGNFGTGNWGNECTLEAIVHNVRKRRPDAELSCLCFEPDDTEARHGLKASRIRDRTPTPMRPAANGPLAARVAHRAAEEAHEWRVAMERARRTDVILMAGTGMLTDVGEGPMGLPYDMFRWSAAARACGSRVMFVGVGVEPLQRPLTRFFVVNALRMADYRSYRDQQSRELLARNGFSSKADAVCPDLAFSLPDPTPPPRAGVPSSRPRVAVGLYDYRSRGAAGGDDATAYRRYVDQITTFIAWLRDRGHGVRIVIGDLTYDEGVLQDVRAALRARSIAGIEDEPATSVEHVMRQLADVDLVVASRFHNVLLALLLGRPAVSMSYNQKNDALMGEMGLAAYCQTLDGLDLARLKAQFEALEGDAARLRPSIRAKVNRYRQDLDAQYDRIVPPSADVGRAPDRIGLRA
jgi:polysaccharide pyruvyl transferase WcaK-like protein